jgi:hypothetical protein
LLKHLMVMSFFAYLNAGSLKNVFRALCLVLKKKKSAYFLAFEKRDVTLWILLVVNKL